MLELKWGNLLETDTYRHRRSPDTSSALMEYFKQKGCACEREILRVEIGGEGLSCGERVLTGKWKIIHADGHIYHGKYNILFLNKTGRCECDSMTSTQRK